MKLLDLNEYVKDTKIYYKDFSGDPPKNKFISYDVDLNTCYSSKDQVDMYNWPLAGLRNIVIQVTSLENLTKKLCDITLGPSILLMAVEQSLGEFYYLTTAFSQSRLVEVDLYERLFSSSPELEANSQTMIMTVRIVSQPGRRRTKQRQSLASLVSASQNINKKIDFLSVSVCKVNNDALEGRNYTTEYECDPTEMIFDVDYYIVSEYIASSLTGRQLDDHIDYDYGQNPFMQPAGIGCLVPEDGFKRKNRFNVESLQFSAQFVTSNGTKGLSYVAYDGYNKVLRLDKDGRKSIYDIDRKNSYHAETLLESVYELTDSVNRTHQCLVAKIDDLTMRNSYTMLERLLGIGMPEQLGAYYLGSEMVDHITYQVYETELVYDQTNLRYNLPILMEPTWWVMPTRNVAFEGIQFFMTYYTYQVPNNLDVRGYRQFEDDDDDDTEPILMIKFIELWEFNRKEGKKSLINRLEFIEFSWSLDVEPSSQDLSGLFNIESCSPERSDQVQLRYLISQHPKGAVRGEGVLEAFKSNSQLVKEHIYEQLAETLDVSRISIAQVDLSFMPAGAIQVEVRLIELPAIVIGHRMLGFVKFNNIINKWKNSIVSIQYNRHSLDSCRVDSMAERKDNTAVFCDDLTLCVLVKNEAIDQYKGDIERFSSSIHTSSDDEVRSSFELSICSVHQYAWGPAPIVPEYSVLNRVKQNSYKLASSLFSMFFRYSGDSGEEDDNEDDEADIQKARYKLVKYKGYVSGQRVKKLDSISSNLQEIQAALEGLRYTTMNEDPSTLNMNLALKTMQSFHLKDRFKFCQMACQMDELCESFSVCLRKKRQVESREDCVLSTVRLNHEHIQQLAGMLIARRGNKTDESTKNELNLQLRVTSNYESQLLGFRQDPECNLHPKDSLSTYELTDKLQIKKSPLSKSSNETSYGIPRVLSLDDCAGLCDETSRLSNLVKSNFTYCPLSSQCVLDGDDFDQLNEGHICYRYRKFHVQFYEKVPVTRLSVVLAQSVADSSAGNNLRIDTNGSKLLEEHKIGRWIEGLDEEACARDCNLKQSNCLAFDLCQFTAATKLCILYSIRSPLSANRKKLGYLSQEHQFYNSTSGGKATLTGVQTCNHFALKDIYFDIKLSAMLDEQQQEATGNEERVKLEESILDQDQKDSDEALKKLNSDSTNGRIIGVESTGGGGRFNLQLVLVGLIVGLVGCVIYDNPKAFTYLRDQWDTFRIMRSQRHATHRISQLALSNNLDL